MIQLKRDMKTQHDEMVSQHDNELHHIKSQHESIVQDLATKYDDLIQSYDTMRSEYEAKTTAFEATQGELTNQINELTDHLIKEQQANDELSQLYHDMALQMNIKDAKIESLTEQINSVPGNSRLALSLHDTI